MPRSKPLHTLRPAERSPSHELWQPRRKAAATALVTKASFSVEGRTSSDLMMLVLGSGRERTYDRFMALFERFTAFELGLIDRSDS